MTSHTIRRLPALAAAATALSLALSACGLSEESDKVGTTQGDTTTLVVGASPTPHGDILRFVDENLAPEANLDLEIKEFADYSLPNRALSDGDLDANYFQHLPFLKAEEKNKGYKLHAYEPGIHLEPLALYSKKYDDISQIPAGSKIGINNDPSNQGRALKLLADNGLIELGDVDPLTATVHDITSNPKNLEFIEADAASLARTLEDTAASVINGNYALKAGLSAKEDALLVESPKDNPYTNLLVVRSENKDNENLKKLNELLHDPKVHDFIEQKWPKGEVIPAF